MLFAHERPVHYLSRSGHVGTVDLEGPEVACQALEFLCRLRNPGGWLTGPGRES